MDNFLKDFRFNIRILHHGGRGFPYYYTGNSADSVLLTDANATTAGALAPGGTITLTGENVTSNFSILNTSIQYLAQDSYYWYKVNTVQIAFPSYVRCPRYYRNIATDDTGSATYPKNDDAAGMASSLLREEQLGDTFRCMDSANFNGHRGWDSSIPYNHNSPTDTYNASAWEGIARASNGVADDDTNHRPNVNHPIYLEQLTENDGSKYAGILVNHGYNGVTDTTTPVYDNANGFICGDVPPFGSGAGDYKGEWYKCGQKYAVHGLMNSYDEHAQLEYGTMQEIWFQFWYHYVITWDTDNSVTKTADDNYMSNHTFWDKRASNTGRYNGTPDQRWPTQHATTSANHQFFHNGNHDNVYFTVNNYRNDYASSGTSDTYDHVHNYPNILFNAFELRGIRFYCDDVNSFNSNTCFHVGKDGNADQVTRSNFIGDSMTNP